jgi:FkbM family methyltransferase
MRQKIGQGIINLSRKLFAGTFVQRWKVTSFIYMKVFGAMYGGKNRVVTFRGAQFAIPTRDITIAPSVLSGEFERQELDILEAVCTVGGTVIDVGANIGLYTVLAAKRVGSSGHVFAFEPVPENIKLLRENLDLNDVSARVEIQEVAVGEKPGELELFLSDRQIGTHSAARSLVGGSRSIRVPMQSIDAFVTSRGIQHIDLVKVDVEGYDGQVVNGAVHSLRLHKPILLIEYAPIRLEAIGQAPSEFIATLSGIYRYCVLLDEFRKRTELIDPADLSKMKIATNVNLILTDQIDALRTFLGNAKGV